MSGPSTVTGSGGGGAPGNTQSSQTKVCHLHSKKSKGIKIGHININRIYSKIDQLEHYIRSNDFDIFCVTETWLNDNVSNSHISIDGYKIFRKDRVGKQGGGELIYVKENIKTVCHDSLNSSPVECLWVEVKLPKLNNVIVGCMYRQPKENLDHFDLILDNIEKAFSINDKVIICGDLNYDYQINETLSNNPVYYIESLFSMSQPITSPTRVTKSSSTLIDVILTSIPECHTLSKVNQVSLSDHYLIETSLIAPKTKQNHRTIRFRNYKDFNCEHFYHELNFELEKADLCKSSDPLLAWNKFKDIFLVVSSSHAPFKEIRLKNRNNPWICKETILLMYRRDNLKTKASENKCDSTWKEYKKANKDVAHKIAQSKSQYFENSYKENKDNPNRLWKDLKLCLPNKYNQAIRSDILTAQQLNNFYASIGNNISARFNHLPDSIQLKGEPSIHQFNFRTTSPKSVSQNIAKLPNKSSNDILNFDTKLLKLSNNIISPVLSHIFNMIISTGHIPDDFKLSRITPIYKGKGHIDHEASYRPISISSHIAKLMEYEVNDQLTEYLSKHNFISPDQSAYLKFHSTTTCLHRVTDDWLQNIDDNLITGACFLDVEKCFNAINHKILLQKLKWHGIDNKELFWFKNYLTNRRQCTFYNDQMSDIRPVNIGIPQGAVLAPILFLIFINDLPQNIGNSLCNMFADDVLLYVTGMTMAEVNSKLQECFRLAKAWYDKNKLSINIPKSNVMAISSVYEDTTSLQAPTFDNQSLNIIETSDYLGLTIDKHLLWEHQVRNVFKKISSKIFILRKLSKILNKELLSKIFLSCIQPHIDYASTIWGHCTKKLRQKIQRLQSQAARIVLQNFDYENFHGIELVRSLKWLNFEQRFQYLNCVLMFKGLHGLVPNYISDVIYLEREINEYSTRSSQNNYVHVPKFSSETFHKAFCVSGPQLWNKLPKEIRNMKTLSQFKKACKAHIFSTV